MGQKFYLTLCVCVILLVNDGKNALKHFRTEETTEPAQVIFNTNLGFAKLVGSFQSSKPSDKLVLVKSRINYHLDGEKSYKPIGGYTHKLELVPCDGLFPSQPQMRSLVDCKSLATQYVEAGISPSSGPDESEKQSGSPGKTYVRQNKYKTNLKLNEVRKGLRPQDEQVLAYPLTESFTQQSIERIFLANDMNSGLGFDAESAIFGQHLIYRETSGILCRADIFIALNKSRDEIPTFSTNHEFYTSESLYQIGVNLGSIIDNGGLVSIQDVKCEHPNASIFTIMPLSLEAEFTLIHRKQFPYITVTHRMRTSPLDSFWNYEGLVRQAKDELAASEAYNTTIKVRSKSVLLDLLDFDLEQKFVNLDFSTGFEKMLFASPFVSATVRSDWSTNSLVKSMELFFTQVSDNPDVSLTYEDKPDDKFVTLNLKLGRDLFQSSPDAEEQDEQMEAAEESGFYEHIDLLGREEL